MKTKLLFLSVALTIATSVLASMPTDINQYTQEGIVKETSLSIPLNYLAFKEGCSSSSSIGVSIKSPSGKAYSIVGTSYTYWADQTLHTYQYFNPISWCYPYTQVVNGYAFFDLQAVEQGTWKLTLVQLHAGDWYYHYDTSVATPVNKGYAIISQDCSKNGKSIHLANPASGHDYVDLGLSVLWATCNVGATTPEGYGDYFAWGETSPKSSYTSSNYTYSDNPSVLPTSHDAATAN